MLFQHLGFVFLRLNTREFIVTNNMGDKWFGLVQRRVRNELCSDKASGENRVV